MANEHKLQSISALVKSTKVLTDSERADWLSMLELMNDKQLLELEAILKTSTVSAETSAPAAASQLPSAPKAAPKSVNSVQSDASRKQGPVRQRMPALSHLSNVPASVLAARQSSKSSPTIPAAAKPSQSAITFSKLKASEKTAEGVSQTTAEVSPVGASQPKARLDQDQASTAIQQQIPTAQKPVKATPRYTEIVTTPGTETVKFSSSEDLLKFNLDSFRTSNRESLLGAMRDLAKAFGYFAVLQLLEKSLLYASYLETGQMLMGKKADKAPDEYLTKEELEFMIDLLIHIRQNRI